MNFVRHAVAAIVIPVHNGLEYTKRCLVALGRVLSDPVMLVLVDDGSTDGTSAYIREHFPEAHLLRGDGSLWWSRAVDLGSRHAFASGAEWILLLNNDDVAVSTNLMVEVRRLLDQGAGCAGVVGLSALPDSAFLLHAGGELDWSGRGATLRRVGERYEPTSLIEECDWLPGMAIAFERAVFDAVGGFDWRRFPQYRGDVDFSLRVRELRRPLLISHAGWVLNDKRQTGLTFTHRIDIRAFATGLFSLRSNYNLRETFAFALAHCPPQRRLTYLAQFYGRYVYATLKSQFRPRLTL